MVPSKSFFFSRVLFAGGVGILVIAGGIFWKGGASIPFFPSLFSSGDVIMITEDGFAPQTLQVKKGTYVRFVNKTDEWHWPASDIHPTHTLYSEFDPKQTIGPGEEWGFIFEKVGEWGMHDHLMPYVTGEIIVVEP